jgi:ankyrin repeat protein
MATALTLEEVEEAVIAGDAAAVAAGLEQGGEAALAISVKDEWFLAACVGGHIQVVALLLGLGGDRAIDVHTWDEWAFRRACWHGRSEVVALLLSHRSVNGGAAAKTARQDGEWGYVVKEKWHALAERPRWLAAVRRAGAMAARAARRRRSCGAGAQCSG